MDKATVYAQAKTCISDKRARQMVTNSIDILRRFYRAKVNRELKFIATEIEDTIIDEVTTQHQSIEKTIENSALLSIDQNISHIQAGDLESVEKNVATFTNAISTAHILYPDFKFGFNEQGQLVSIRLNDEALKRHPPRLLVSAKAAKIGDTSLTEIDDQVLLKSYRHQIPISLDDVTAVQYLGDVRDPSQTTAAKVTGPHAEIAPPRFPELRCNVIIDGEVAVSYLLLRIKEILDNGTYVITNDEQNNFNFKVKMLMNMTSRQLSFTIKPTNTTNYELLQYRRFLKKASKAQKVVLQTLDQNIELASVNNLSQIDLVRLDNEIEFLQMVVAIEEFWDIHLSIPHEIQPRDHRLIYRLYSMIKNGVYQGVQEYFIFTAALSKALRESINNSESEKIHSLIYTNDIAVLLFDQTIRFPLLRRIDGVKIDHLEELKEEITSLDDGTQVKVKYIPAGQNKKIIYTDAFFSEETKQKLLNSQAMQSET